MWRGAVRVGVVRLWYVFLGAVSLDHVNTLRSQGSVTTDLSMIAIKPAAKLFGVTPPPSLRRLSLTPPAPPPYSPLLLNCAFQRNALLSDC